MGVSKDAVDAILNQKKTTNKSSLQPVSQSVDFVKENKKEWWNPLSWFASASDIYNNLQRGAAKSLEGMADFVISQAGGAIADLFNSDSLEKEIEKITKYDVTGAIMDKPIIGNSSLADITNRGFLGVITEKDFVEENTLIKDGGTIEKVAQGIGGMLPAVAIGQFTGGSTIATYGAFGASAGGQSTQEALNEGASLDGARAYGVGSALLETGVEAISGGVGGVGTGVLQKVAPKLTKNVAAKFVGNMAGEAVEEMVSEWANPYLKRATYDENAENATLDEILESGAIGALTGGIMQGGTLVNLAKYGVKGEKAISLYNEAQAVNAEMYELEKKGKLTPQLRQDYLKKRNNLLAEVGNTISEISNETKKSRVGSAITPTMKQTAEFDARKTLVDETVKSYNDRTGSDLKVEYVDNAEINGSYDPKTNTISIDKNAENPYSIVLGHEITHSTESNSKYAEVYDEVLNAIGETNLAQERENLGKYEQYKNLSVEEMNKEIVANYISENFFTNFKQAQKLISNNKTLGNKIISFIKDKLARIGKNKAEYKQLKSIENVLQEIMDNKEISVANIGELAVQYSGKKNIKISKEEYAILKEQIMKQNTIGKRSNRAVDYAFTANYFYIYNNSGLDSFQVTKKIKINKNENRINALRRVIDGSNGNRKISDSEIKEFISRKRSDIRNSSSYRNGRTTTGNVGVSGEPRGNFSRGDIEQGSSNNGTGVKYSAKQTPVRQEQNDSIIDESLKNKIKTVLIEEDLSFIERIQGLTEKGKQAIKDIYNNKDVLKSNMQIWFTNSFAGAENALREKIEREGLEKGWTKKEIKSEQRKQVEELSIAYNNAYRATSKAEFKIGNDLKQFWSKVNKKGFEYTNELELFLLHRLNIKRMDFSGRENAIEEDYKNGAITEEEYNASKEEIENAQKKPVFGEQVSADKSREQVELLEKKHPEFVELAEEVYNYLENLMNIRKQYGIVNDAQIKRMFDWYGDKDSGKSWYVPTYRDFKHGANLSGLSGNIGVTKGIHKAKGSDKDIKSIMVSMSEQTIGVYKQTAINDLFLKVKEKLPEHFELVGKQKQNREDMNGKIEVDKDKKNTTVYFYEDGNRVEYRCSSFIGVAFESIRNQQSNLEKILDNTTGKMVSLLKKVTTEWNPFFALRNLFRDASDAFIYTKYSKNLFKRYGISFNEIRKGPEKSAFLYLYMREGGQNFSFFDRETGIKNKKKFFLLEKISNINEATELAPRLSEFIESLKAQGYDNVTMETIDNIPQEVLDKAMYDASEVTVNFARGGTFTKAMNRYLMPYLNASVQGTCKMYNTFVHPESVRALGLTMARVVMMALPTIIFNELLLGDDEEYEQLSDDIKGSYFLIKLKDNKFIRIPRGRVEAVVGDAIQRGIRTAKGEENAFDGYVDNTLSNVSPLENMSRTILSPIGDVKNNVTWYGGQIENASMQNKPINERYDNNTSAIAKFLNKVYPSLSPKKWHYLLDQYSGIIGDIVLPSTSKNNDAISVLSKASGFYTNSLNNNKYTNQFYSMQEQLTQAKNSENATGVDDAKMRYFNKMNTKISALYKEKNSKSGDEADATQLLIVQLQKQTLDNLKSFSEILDKYSYGLSIDELYEDYYREATRECFGAETALMDYDKRVYEKATNFNKSGIDWNTFYNVYFDAQDITSDYDENGDAISGSRKQKITKYVKSLKLTATQKYMLMGLLGYKNANGESQVKSQLIRSGFKGEELKEMMELCGYGK